MSIVAITANYAKASKSEGSNAGRRWTRPEPRNVKLIVDAAFYLDMGAGATGVIIHDFQGQFIAASCTYLPNVASAAMAEAVAMKEGLAPQLMYARVLKFGGMNELLFSQIAST
jgi:hypothetical protein